jgi:phosphoenolpyruvate-protein kinase (PTS system EI component)
VEEGAVTLSASKDSLDSFHISKNRYNHVSTLTAEREKETCTTIDGVEIKLMANIGRVEEAEQVLQHHLDGIGLYRTEFLYLRSAEVPARESQIKAYAEVAQKLGDLPVVIRTLDLGGDKKPDFVDAGFETNPNLGSRGLRFSLSESGLLDTQLDAIAASHAIHTNIRVLFPMVLGEDDLRQSVEKLRKTGDERSVRQTPDVGAMIETPSALFELNEILERADFISIGTNDLAQFMLAADRNTLGLVQGNPATYPSVLRAVKKVVDAAKKKRRPVCICGEAAGDPTIACLFVGLGVRQLSMSPVRAARVRYAIRKTNSDDLEELASKALESSSLQEIQSLLLEFENRTQVSTAETQISGQKISEKTFDNLENG